MFLAQSLWAFISTAQVWWWIVLYTGCIISSFLHKSVPSAGILRNVFLWSLALFSNFPGGHIAQARWTDLFLVPAGEVLSDKILSRPTWTEMHNYLWGGWGKLPYQQPMEVGWGARATLAPKPSWINATDGRLAKMNQYHNMENHGARCLSGVTQLWHQEPDVSLWSHLSLERERSLVHWNVMKRNELWLSEEARFNFLVILHYGITPNRLYPALLGQSLLACWLLGREVCITKLGGVQSYWHIQGTPLFLVWECSDLRYEISFLSFLLTF